MAARAVIPPLHVESLPEKPTYELLESRLQNAEQDTRQLLQQLSGLGFDTPTPDKPTSGFEKGMGEHPQNMGSQNSMNKNYYEPVSPFRGQVSESHFQTLKNNYESVVTRLCKNESVLQSLKLNLVNLQGDRSLRQKQEAELKEKFQMAREAYEQEIGKLTRQVEYLKDEVSTESDGREKAREEVKELQSALGHATETRMETAMNMEGLGLSQQKLQKRISELKEEVGREQSLRASLEQSHNTLLARVRDMENVVEQERSGMQKMSAECGHMQTEAEVLKDHLVQKMSAECGHMKTESEVLKDQLKEETRRKQIAESSYKMLCDEKDSLASRYESAETDRRMLISELSRLREQYEELIKQMEETQTIIDKQQNRVRELEATNTNLEDVLRTTAASHDKQTTQFVKDLEAERKRSCDKEKVEEEARTLKDSVADLTEQNTELTKKVKQLEAEIAKLKKKAETKEAAYTKNSDAMETELDGVKEQLKQLSRERDKINKDKESLLEEVNQTVDSMAAERAKLQKQIQQHQLELDSHSRARSKLEHENAALLERVAGFEHQQQAQKHIETTLKEMMETKNKLAYDNGRLQTHLEQTSGELESLRRSDLDTAKYKQLTETLTSKYSQSESEISQLKVTIQRQESQLKQLQTQLHSQQCDYSSATGAREDLQKDNQRLLTKLQTSEEREKRKVKALQKTNEDAKSVNKEIAATLESVMASHSQLQAVVENLQVDLGKKDSHISRLKNEKNREQQEWKVEMQRFEERMETMREELKKERDKSTRKNSRDMAEIKKQGDNLSSRNMELLKANTDLRQKLREQESTVQELKDKVADQKRRIDYLHRTKKDVEESVQKMKEMKSDIEELENLRDTYMAKNTEQADMISTFMAQINSLQTELRQLAHAQAQTRDLVVHRDRTLDRERKIKDDIKRKYKESKKREDEIEHMKAEAERRLHEVKDESLEISSHLKSAHEWFKDKFENLQGELVSSRQMQERLESENNSQKKKLDGERHKAQLAAEKAREMIKASRQTISRLSDYADLADAETKDQLSQLYGQLQREKDHSKYMEMKHARYKEAAGRQMETLLQETEDTLS